MPDEPRTVTEDGDAPYCIVDIPMEPIGHPYLYDGLPGGAPLLHNPYRRISHDR